MFRWRIQFLCMAVSVGAANYYLDPVQGDDTRAGTATATAWKTLARASKIKFAAGDSLLLKRGGVWSGDSLFLAAVGTAEKPVVVAPYGDPSGPRPHASNRGNLVALRNSRHVVVRDLALSGARGGCIELRDSTNSNIRIESIEAWDCGGGIYLTGTDITVRGCHIHDGHMVVNTKDVMDDDYGATGIGFSQLDGCTVVGNRLVNLAAASYDYGTDGGALEFWKTVRRCDIHGNFAYRVDGFSEFGGQKGDSVVDVAIHHNVLLEAGIMTCLHIRDSTSTFGVGYDGLRFDNNLSVTRYGRPASHHVIADGGVLPDKKRVQVRNNIFVTDSSNYYSYQQKGSALDPSWSHEYNLLWNPKNNPFKVDRTAGTGEIYAKPGFADSTWNASSVVDTVLAKYALGAGSPAVGSGTRLGYATDFHGNPADRSGVVDRGPFALGSRTNTVFPASPRARRRILAHSDGRALRLLLESDAESVVQARWFSPGGVLLGDLGTWSVEPGPQSRVVALPTLATGSGILHARFRDGQSLSILVPVIR